MVTPLAVSTAAWGFFGTLVSVLAGIIALLIEQRKARAAAVDAAVVAGQTKVTVEDTKATAEQTKSLISDMASAVDAATLAGLLNESHKMLERATIQLVRCEDENRQLVAVVKVLERKIDACDRELADLRATVSAMEQKPRGAKRTPGR